MGTNYYAYINPCPHCQRSDEDGTWHIGKKSGGWQFTFRGYKGEYEGPCRLDSFNAWVGFLVSKEHEVLIKDEYGDTITASEFIDMVTSSKGGNTMAQWAAETRSSLDCEDWVDEEGYDFSPREFT